MFLLESLWFSPGRQENGCIRGRGVPQLRFPLKPASLAESAQRRKNRNQLLSRRVVRRAQEMNHPEWASSTQVSQARAPTEPGQARQWARLAR